MKRIGIVIAILFLAGTITRAWSAEQTVHTYKEVRGYLVAIKEIQKAGDELLKKAQEKTVSAGQAIKETQQSIEKLKKIKPSWEFENYHTLLEQYYGEMLNQYKEMGKTGIFSDAMKKQEQDRAMQAYRALIEGLKKLKEEGK